jgi:hypothetical protein
MVGCLQGKTGTYCPYKVKKWLTVPQALEPNNAGDTKCLIAKKFESRFGLGFIGKADILLGERAQGELRPG